MLTVTITEARTHFSRIIRTVKTGETVAITRCGKVVAKIYPVIEETPELMAEIKRQCERANEADSHDSLDDFGDWTD